MRFSPKKTYKAQNSICRTLVGHYSTTKRISEMYLLEREQWLSEIVQKHQSSVIYSFIFIHSVRSETDRTVHSVHCSFYTKRGRWETLHFSNEEISRFHTEHAVCNVTNFSCKKIIRICVNLYEFRTEFVHEIREKFLHEFAHEFVNIIFLRKGYGEKYQHH